MKYLCFVVATVIMLSANLCFSTETVEKVDGYSAKVVISNITDREGLKTTVTQERVFTLEELQHGKAASEKALASWQDEAKKVADNITIQTSQVALWQRLIDEYAKQGIIEKPKEEPKVGE